MKEQWSISSEKLVSLEEGHENSIPIKEGFTYPKPVNTHHICELIIQCVKLILYLELLLFVGWASYTIWQSYHINSMEVKVIDNIREAESKSIFGQQLTFIEDYTSTVAPEELQKSENTSVSTTEISINTTEHVGDSHPDNKQPFNEEHDIITTAKPDRDSPTKDSESSSVLTVNSADIVKINEYDGNAAVYNFPETLDHFIIKEPEQEKHKTEENSEYYALLSLLLQNAIKKKAMKDYTTDSSSDLQDSSVLSGLISTAIDGDQESWEYQDSHENLGIVKMEPLPSINGGNWEPWYWTRRESQENQDRRENEENLTSHENQESQENLDNLDTQENWNSRENWENKESQVNQESQEYEKNHENLGIVKIKPVPLINGGNWEPWYWTPRELQVKPDRRENEENLKSHENQESQENLENLDTQENWNSRENWENKESQVNQESQEYEKNHENLGIVKIKLVPVGNWDRWTSRELQVKPDRRENEENLKSHEYQESQENLKNLDTQENWNSRENWENQESQVNQENQEYQENHDNLGIVENQENQESQENLDALENQEKQEIQENLDALKSQENQESQENLDAVGIQESQENLKNVEAPILFMDDDYVEKELEEDTHSMFRPLYVPFFTDKSDNYFKRIRDMHRTDYANYRSDSYFFL